MMHLRLREIQRDEVFVMKPQRIRGIAIWLGSLSSIGIALSWLSLQDIFHGYERDLSMEWWVVRCALVVSVAFHVVSLVALKRPVKS